MPPIEKHLREIASDLKREGSPVSTQKAEYLWRWCSGLWLPVETAKDIYSLGGYVPFSGFPLKRNGRS